MENYRLILFSALVLVLFLMWDAWQTDYGPIPLLPPPPQPTASSGESSPVLPEAVPDAPPPEMADMDTAPILTGQKTIEVKTDLLAIKIGMASGDLYEVQLLNYPVSLKKPNEPVTLLHKRDPDLFVTQSGLRAASGPSITHETVQFSAPKTYYELIEDESSLKVPLTWEDENGIKVTKTYIFQRDSYQIDLNIKIENGTDQAWMGRAYAQFSRTPPESGGMFARSYVGAVFSTQEQEYQKVDFGDLASQSFDRRSSGGWVAMIQHYFVAAWVPREQGTNYYYGKHVQNSRYIAGVMPPQQTIAPGESGQFNLALFTGPKIQDQLAAVAPKLNLTVDYGKLTILAEPLFWLMSWFHNLVGNWGWAIVLLTFVVKLVFFKLSQTSYRSMARMRKLQPRLLALKERYGDDRQKVGQAMMELYRKEKVNPMGGCLPIVVQIPVFIALYWMLLESVELRQAPFIFWIQDLTSKDPYYILPLLMGVSMFVQQKLSPAPTDPIQAKVMALMPVMFTVFFVMFPAGLVLYWVVNNILSIAQQWYITRQIEQEG
ncbi:membrane protein insertase YidC [Nitrosococcus oceani]|uniref:Membrane protein insertase YidC n=2 Tax=Nitrosococcus oceani TaxID=1229 RepID=YIDC_NITOC|nr:membrane protein insertase YidC [Nitrosococcus oceani]Q3J6L8.1 RecName: Full=Membrane protein insertase YidC; AltName: Full=Foldase YidC; AltName: Full=Membrane integrase YidC; AltName: Full=Membrane protein YidC [Nitrosococcus oceani ATCC 19707]KFI18094.1 membrane protein insertase [Nitrosococcus oceani C-27]ABA59528.1 protein translocase subunit yidC [Nitrosococcus oceani ATCC 19707]EDZ65742.1 60Kd inner membrane protein [Nitrosococcus oceani AFC27]KFI24093.1 membrane protein insertase [N